MNLHRIRTLSGIPGSMRVPSMESPIFFCEFLCSWWPWMRSGHLWLPVPIDVYINAWCLEENSRNSHGRFPSNLLTALRWPARRIRKRWRTGQGAVTSSHPKQRWCYRGNPWKSLITIVCPFEWFWLVTISGSTIHYIPVQTVFTILLKIW